MTRRFGSRACLIAAGLILGSGTVWLIASLARLDPNDPDSGVAAGFLFFIIGGGSLALALLLAGSSVLLSSDRKAGLPIYFTALGVTCFVAAMTILRPTDWSVVLLLAAAGSFSVVWRRLAALGQQQAALAAAVVAAGTTIFRIVPLPIGVLDLGIVVTLLLNILRFNERLRRSMQ